MAFERRISTVRMATPIFAAIDLLSVPFTTSFTTSNSPGVKLSNGFLLLGIVGQLQLKHSV